MCGQTTAQVRTLARSYGKGKNLFVIENVPVIMCAHCGGSYLTTKTLHEIERIKLHRKSFSKKRYIPVAAFN